MSTNHSPMVVAAARELCKRASEVCNVDFEDNWKIYGSDFIADAKAALDACGAPELLEALQAAEQKLVELEHAVGGGDDEFYVEGAILKARAAIARATGEAQS